MTVPWPELESALTDLRFALIAEQESKRTLLVPVEDYDRAMWHVEQNGLEDLVTVLASQFVQPGTWWVVDKQAMDADWEEGMQQIRMAPPFPASPTWSTSDAWARTYFRLTGRWP